MKRGFPVLFSLFALLLLAPTVLATNTEALVRKAVSTAPAEANAAIAELRAMGPAGLSALVESNAAQIKAQIANPYRNSSEWRRISASLDAVSQQKDSYLGQLYWYTDLKEAKAAARASGKPILSLRLLGKLTEELSCANSRFFRSLLYSNAEVSNTLRNGYILHWQTHRNVPQITIDFGDGRKIQRTVTGNSVHYILDAEGRTIDGMPGLYGPAAFLRGLERANEVVAACAGKTANECETLVSHYHRRRANALTVAFSVDTKKIGGQQPEGLIIQQRANGEAIAIMPAAITKAMTEATVLRSMTAGAEALGQITDEAAWRKIAALHLDDAELDSASIGLIQKQTHNLFANNKEAFNRMLQTLQQNIALDTVRNEYLLHTKLHAWLTWDSMRLNNQALNERVYAELFLTPSSDPWFGLLSADLYTGLDKAGVVKRD